MAFRRCSRRELAALSCAFALLLGSRIAAGKVGYGYKKAEDPLILGVKRIIYSARTGSWDASMVELRRLDWQFKEFREDLGVDIGDRFRAAVEARSLSALSREVARVMYHAVEQKLHWNLLEKCARYVPARSRVEAALFYYEQILSIGVRAHDRKKRSHVHEEVMRQFAVLRRAIGTAGLFGIGARPPDLAAFRASSAKILADLRRVYPFVAPSPRWAGGSQRTKPSTAGGAPR